MNLFINDVFVKLVSAEEVVSPARFNHIIVCGIDAISRANLIHHVWIKNPSANDIDKLLELLDTAIPRNLFSVTISSNEFTSIKHHLKSKFKIMKAAGGVVKKGSKILMIYRLKKWDLPKGKINKNEVPKEAALREVREECNIDVSVNGKICNTWHTYTMKKRLILKKTSWFLMKLKDDSQMKPQVEEDIEEIKWMSRKEVFHSFDHSYRSIQFVINEYLKTTSK